MPMDETQMRRAISETALMSTTRARRDFLARRRYTARRSVGPAPQGPCPVPPNGRSRWRSVDDSPLPFAGCRLPAQAPRFDRFDGAVSSLATSTKSRSAGELCARLG